MYAYISDQYLHVLQVLDHWGTETATESPKHPLVTPHPGGPTQGTPGQVTNHCLTPSLSPPSTRFFDFFMKNQCLALSCHGHRNGQYPLEGPKLCPIALPQALYRTQSRALRSDIYLWLEEVLVLGYYMYVHDTACMNMYLYVYHRYMHVYHRIYIYM